MVFRPSWVLGACGWAVGAARGGRAGQSRRQVAQPARPVLGRGLDGVAALGDDFDGVGVERVREDGGWWCGGAVVSSQDGKHFEPPGVLSIAALEKMRHKSDAVIETWVANGDLARRDDYYFDRTEIARFSRERADLLA